MNITQTFYDNLASQYDKLFLDWQATTQEQAVILDNLFRDNGFDKTAHILDCACGIGTQAIGLAAMGMLSTTAMVQCGHVYENLMINLKPSNKKLRRRVISIVTDILKCDAEKAEVLLDQNDWNIRAAVEAEKAAKA